MSLVERLKGHRLVVCVGPGGVGKTTLAASIALEAACHGRRALVLTIDPARRLADALGLDGLDDTLREVDIGATGSLVGHAVSQGATGTLHAAMLDTSASYDNLIERIAEPDAAKRIRANAVYRAFSKTLARSHAYIAAERLYEVMRDDRFDLVILDTPPTRSALEILDAPKALSQFLDQDVLRFFERRSGSFPTLASIARAGGRAVLAMLGRIAGAEVVDELVEFFRVLSDQQEGFADRAAANTKTLRADDTLYCLVTALESAPLSDAAFLAEQLRARHRAPALVLFNRAYPVELDVAPAALPPRSDERVLAGKLVRWREHVERQFAARSVRAHEFLESHASAETQAYLLAEMDGDVRDLQGLAALVEGLRPLAPRT